MTLAIMLMSVSLRDLVQAACEWGASRNVDTIYFLSLSLSLLSDSCATEQTVFDPANTINRTLNWMEAAIGAVAMIPCPCGEFEIGREATRVCMGNFRTRGMWREPDYSSCEFTEKTWQLCDATQVSECNIPFSSSSYHAH